MILCCEDETRGLVAHPVKTQAAALTMARIRNAGRDGFSGDTAEITPGQQMAWWRANRTTVRAWLFANAAGILVGFGMLRPLDAPFWTTSVGVLPEHAGHGFGGAITRALVHQSTAPLRAQARLDNPAAVRVHDAGHWDRVPSGHPDLAVFEAKQ